MINHLLLLPSLFSHHRVASSRDHAQGGHRFAPALPSDSTLHDLSDILRCADRNPGGRSKSLPAYEGILGTPSSKSLLCKHQLVFLRPANLAAFCAIPHMLGHTAQLRMWKSSQQSPVTLGFFSINLYVTHDGSMGQCSFIFTYTFEWLFFMGKIPFVNIYYICIL